METNINKIQGSKITGQVQQLEKLPETVIDISKGKSQEQEPKSDSDITKNDHVLIKEAEPEIYKTGNQTIKNEDFEHNEELVYRQSSVPMSDELEECNTECIKLSEPVEPSSQEQNALTSENSVSATHSAEIEEKKFKNEVMATNVRQGNPNFPHKEEKADLIRTIKMYNSKYERVQYLKLKPLNEHSEEEKTLLANERQFVQYLERLHKELEKLELQVGDQETINSTAEVTPHAQKTDATAFSFVRPVLEDSKPEISSHGSNSEWSQTKKQDVKPQNDHELEDIANFTEPAGAQIDLEQLNETEIEIRHTEFTSVEIPQQLSVCGVPTGGPIFLYRQNYLLMYDTWLKIPRWVKQHLNAEMLVGDANRKNCSFTEDTQVKKVWQACKSDFKGTIMSHGHMASSSHSRHDQTAMDETFLYTNILPQHPHSNNGIWNELERYCEKLTEFYEDIYIISGPLFIPENKEDGTKEISFKVIGNNNVAVPTHLFKVIVTVADDGFKQYGAFKVPNDKTPEKAKITDFQVYLQEVERLSGLMFFEAETYITAKEVKWLKRAGEEMPKLRDFLATADSLPSEADNLPYEVDEIENHLFTQYQY